MPKFIVFAHDSRFEIVADEMTAYDNAFEFFTHSGVRHSEEDETDIIAAITSYGYAYSEDADLEVFDLSGE